MASAIILENPSEQVTLGDFSWQNIRMSIASDATQHCRAWTCRSRPRPQIRTWRSSGQAGPCRSGQDPYGPALSRRLLPFESTHLHTACQNTAGGCEHPPLQFYNSFAKHFTFYFVYGKILSIVKLQKLSFRCNDAHERELFA